MFGRVVVPLQGKGSFTAATNSGRAAAMTPAGGSNAGEGPESDGPSQVRQVTTNHHHQPSTTTSTTINYHDCYHYHHLVYISHHIVREFLANREGPHTLPFPIE
ncbi:putative ionotropic GABA receptor beta subunit 1b-like [Homarus americanus]|uniref:Putative ionotropic GABA receptor beta subunit 1b-like n=1 Tax=Homarus americanus TaxID=6706 RepID=A0A8J5JP65_HOMAM|nr:putative ionotropic GABA receptor beta subunit 1b-like [Homarus americanus]